jgi:hypothetical protein
MADRPKQDPEVPVLTEIVDDQPHAQPVVDAEALEALARELDRVIEEKLARTLNSFLGQSVDGMRTELTQNVSQMVREAVHASVARALTSDKRGKPG